MMAEIIHRMQTGERCWPAEIVLRGFGLGLLCLCAAASLLLYHSVHVRPPHDPRPIEIAEAIVVVASWSLGGALLGEGSGLFRLVRLPGRHARFPSESPDTEKELT